MREPTRNPPPVSAALAVAAEDNPKRLPHPALSIVDVDAVEAAAVTQLYARFTEAFNRHDPVAMAALWTLDGDHVEPDGTTARGRSEVRSLFEKEHAVVFHRATLSLQLASVWMVTQEVALADGSYRIVGAVDRQGNPLAPREGRLTSVLLKEDGQWWVAASRLMIPVPLAWRER